MKTNNLCTILLTLIVIIGCSQVVEKPIIEKPVAAKEVTTPIYIEEVDPNDPDENKYTKDNVIYIPKRNYTIEYAYTKENINYLYEQNGDEWILFPVDSIKNHPNTVNSISLEAQKGNLFKNSMPDYDQTSITYTYNPFTEFNITGVVENENNLWIHPPRQGLFRILEINPFPYVKFPLEIGNTWDWSLKAGDHWSDKRWKVWKGNVDTFYEYEVTGFEKMDTPLGTLDCYSISATGKSRLGNTGLTAYFNEKYGFVRLDYRNIDGSTLQLKVIRVEQLN